MRIVCRYDGSLRSEVTVLRLQNTGDDFMSTLFNDLQQGLEEAIAYEKGQGDACGVCEKTYMIQSSDQEHPLALPESPQSART